MINIKVIGGGILLAIAFYHLFVFPLFVSPLSKVPSSHWSSKFSSAWSLWVRYRGTELEHLVKAHEKYGPLVQIGPADLSVSSYQDGIRKVYDAGCGKPTSWYSMFDYYGNANAFTSVTSKEHGSRRRRTAGLYSKSSLLQSSHMNDVSHEIMYSRVVPRLRDIASRSVEIDSLELSYSMSCDYLSSFLFGLCNGTNFLSLDKKNVDNWRLDYENTSCNETFFKQEMPLLYNSLLKLGIDLMPKSYHDSKKSLEHWMSSMAQKADRAISHRNATGQAIEPKDQAVIYEAAKLAVEKDSPHLDSEGKRKEVASEMFDHVSAAREVFGLVMSYAFWYLSQNPSVQERIRHELEEAGIDMRTAAERGPEESSWIPAALAKLPYLNAVIDESLRMRPTSTPLPRVTPPGRPVSVAGYDNIPPGTRINAFQWFVHRDSNKWDRVDEFVPERWLEREGKTGRREDVLWPFTSGPRMCLGTNWTYYAMGYAIAVVVSSFELEAGSRKAGACWPGSPEDHLPLRVRSVNMQA